MGINSNTGLVRTILLLALCISGSAVSWANEKGGIYSAPEGAEDHIPWYNGSEPYLITVVGDNATQENIEPLKLTLERGDDPNMHHRNGTPLEIAVERNNPRAVRLLLEYGADPFHPEMEPALAVKAVESADSLFDEDAAFEILMLLKEAGVDLAAFENDIRSVLGELANNWEMNLIMRLYYEGVRLQVPNGRNELFIMVRTSELENAKKLIELGADLSYTLPNGTTLLMDSNSVELDKLLIGHGVDVNASTDHGHTALMVAAASKYDTTRIELLFNNGANPNSVSKSGLTPLAYAAQYNYYDIIELLLKNGADASHLDDIGDTTGTVLHYLWRSGDKAHVSHKNYKPVLDATRLLIKHGADINALGKHKSRRIEKRILDLAVYENREEIISPLWEMGARMTDAGYNYLITYTAADEIVALLKAGDDLEYLNDRGQTVLTGYCEKAFNVSGNFSEMVTLMAKAGVDLNAQDNQGKTALHYIVEKSEAKTPAAYLVRAGADTLIHDKQGNSPFYLAVKSGEAAVIDGMIRQSSNVNRQDQNGNTMADILLSGQNELSARDTKNLLQLLKQKGAHLKLNYSGGISVQQIIQHAPDGFAADHQYQSVLSS